MPTVSETIPSALQPEVDAALEWFNREQGEAFEVTGIVDCENSLEASGPRELRLVLCGGNLCEQRTFQVSAGADGYEVELREADAGSLGEPGTETAELDPPPGARRNWIDKVLAEHAFVVLVFYRGFW